jgi:capsular polysaccharide biosynthesis protein
MQNDVPVTVTDCDDFHRVDTAAELLTPDDRRPNRILHHDPARPIVRSLSPARRGVDVFGDGRASEVDGWRFRDYPACPGDPYTPAWHGDPYTRAAFTFALDRGILLPGSTAIISADDRLIHPSVENFAYWGGIEHRELSIANVDGQLIWHSPPIDDADVIAVSAAGVAYMNYGHFLLDGLPLVYLLVNSMAGRLREDELAIVCPPLQPWQREILCLLNLDRLVRVIERPTRFGTLAGNSFLSQHVTCPTRYARTVFDALKFAVPSVADAPEKIFIVRTNQEARVMRNQDQLVQRMLRRGYTTIASEQYSIREQIQLFSRAKIVVGATGAGFANVGFAPPGAKVVEIMAESQPDQWMRRLSLLLAHRWHGYIHPVEETRGLQVAARFFPLFNFSFDLPLDDFEEALSIVEMT